MRNKLTVSLIGAAGGVYLLERQGRRWGATETEVTGSLPGDELVSHPWLETTHAITVRAPAAAVWPWLVQMGYGRAGWYTNAWWYRLIDTHVFHVDMARADRVVPELQQLTIGDVIPDGPPGTASFTVARLERERLLALYSTTHGTVWLPPALRDDAGLGIHCELGWAFVLREPAPGTTRLILRARMSGGPAPYRALVQALMPLADLLVARLMLRTIKHNVEQAEGVVAPQEATRLVEPVDVVAPR